MLVDLLRERAPSGRPIVRARPSGASCGSCPDPLRRQTAALSPEAVDPGEYLIVQIAFARTLDGIEMGLATVGRYLHRPHEAAREVVDEGNRGFGAAVADLPRRDQLGVGIDRYPGPNIPERARFSRTNILCLQTSRARNVVEMKPLAFQVAKRLVLKLDECRGGVGE